MPTLDKVKKYIDKAREVEDKYNIPPYTLVGLLATESGFRDDVIKGEKKSSVGAVGIAQFMPNTAKEYGIDPLNVDQAIDAAGRYLSKSYKTFQNWDDALRSYNMGVQGVKDWKSGKKKLPKETEDYTGKVWNFAKTYGGNDVVPQRKEVVEEKIPPMEKQIATTNVTDLLNTPEITNFEPQTENEIQFLNEIKSVGIIPQQISVPQLNINTQQPTQQTVQPTPRMNISDIYDRISQFVETPVAQQGGNITQSELDFLSEIAVKDNLGFWNPNNQGKVVEINSPRISMKNLNYDVLGISKETGEKKIMKPNQEYYFKDTQKVIELPLQKY